MYIFCPSSSKSPFLLKILGLFELGIKKAMLCLICCLLLLLEAEGSKGRGHALNIQEALYVLF